jgi:hypothetical protein
MAPRGRPAPVLPPAHYTYNNFRSSQAQYAIDSRRYTIQVNNSVVVNNFYQSPAWGGHWRYGYVNPGLSISFGGFSLGLYVCSPFAQPCVPSPWYYYPGVPAYVPCSHVYVVPGYSWNWSVGSAYAWQRSAAYDSYGDAALNHAITDVNQLFIDRNVNAGNDLIGGGRVAVFAEGHYEYSLAPADFSAMLADNVNATQTVGYQVNHILVNGNTASITATHQFRNADGSIGLVHQRFRLYFDGSRYVVSDFMTSHADTY